MFGLAVFFLFAGVAILLDVPRATHPALWGLAIYAAMLGMTCVVYAFGTLKDLRLMPLAIALQIGSSVFAKWATRADQTLTPAMLHQRLQIDALACFTLVILGYAFFIRFIHRVSRGHADLRTEVRLAKGIHDSLVPVVSGRVAGADYYGRSQASGTIGGDLVDVVERPEGTTFYVADVSGHGVAAGVLMAMLRTAARTALADGATLEGMLRHMNHTVCELQRPGTFATCAVLRLGSSGEAHYALAGHLPILRRNVSTGVTAELNVGGPPLGLKSDQEYPATAVDVAAGDVFLIITDGLTEVFSSGRELGFEGIRAAAFEGDKTPANIAERVIACAGHFGRQLDDQTVLIVKAGMDHRDPASTLQRSGDAAR